MSWTYGTIVAEQYHRLKRTGALGQGCNIQSFPGVLIIISNMNGWWSDKCTQSISREVHDGSSSGWDTVQIMFANLKHRTYSHRFFQTTCLCAQNVTGLDNLLPSSRYLFRKPQPTPGLLWCLQTSLLCFSFPYVANESFCKKLSRVT